jgi:replicative DNA helicase
LSGQPLHAVVDPGPSVPPHDLRAEEAVIGCALLTARVVPACRIEEALTPDRFYRDRHRLIWSAIVDIFDQGADPDVLSVCALLRDRGELDAAGGHAAIEALTGTPPSISGARRYARIVVDAWKWRTRLAAVFDAQAAVHGRDEESLQTALAAATGTAAHATADPRPAAVAARVARRLVDAREENKAASLPLPWPTLARRFRMRPGQTTVLASWTSFGKSWVALELAAHVGQKTSRGAAVIWTNEMSEDELVARQVQRATGVSAERVLDADAASDDRPEDVASALRQLPFGIAECFGWPADEIARHLRHLRPALAVIDHFHQLPGVADRQVADEAVRVLVDAARQTGTHLLLVSQLNHARDLRELKPAPARRDLRGTGNLQSLPNNIVFLHREQERDPETGQIFLTDRGTLHVDKQRGGRDHLYQDVFMLPSSMAVREGV